MICMISAAHYNEGKPQDSNLYPNTVLTYVIASFPNTAWRGKPQKRISDTQLFPPTYALMTCTVCYYSDTD